MTRSQLTAPATTLADLASGDRATLTVGALSRANDHVLAGSRVRVSWQHGEIWTFVRVIDGDRESDPASLLADTPIRDVERFRERTGA